MPQQIVSLKVAGLHTNDQYLQEVPPGALLACTNYNHDRQGIIEKRRGFFLYGDQLASIDDRVKELFSYKGVVFRHYGTTLEFDDGTGTYTAFLESFTEPSSELRMKGIEVNGNFYVTTDQGIKKLDATSSTTISVGGFKDAGGLKALTLEGTTSGATGFLPHNSKVAYRIVWGINDSNNNLILGTPSEILIVENTSGGSTNVELTFPIPDNATSDHFYQVYRSAVVDNTKTPEDEMYLVIEDFPTTQEFTGKEVDIVDVTPETFREGGTLLYTNPISGEGILQANEPPPLANDIALYKNFTFYANTKTRHKLTINLLSVDDLYDGESSIVISDGTNFDEFTFDTIEDKNNGIIKRETGSTTAVNIDETARSLVRVINAKVGGVANAYYVSGVDDVPGEILLERRDQSDIPFYVGLDNGDFEEFNPAFDQIGSFDSNSVASSTVISMKTQSFDPSTDINGTNEITINNHSLFTGQEVVFSGDIPSGITGGDKYYVVRLTENTFQLAETKSETKKPSPSIVPITASGAPGTTILTETHGLYQGDTIEIFDDSSSTPSINGTHTITFIDDVSFSIPVNVTVQGTGGRFVRTSTTSDNEKSGNRLYFSKLQQPEAVPVLNFVDIGPKDKEIKRIAALRDSLFIFKEDGIYRLSGDSSASFTVFSFDSSAVITAPDSLAILNNQIYVLTSRGLIQISDTGSSIISKQIENLLYDATNNNVYTTATFGLASETDRSYYLWITEKRTDSVATQCLRYNTDTLSWSKWDRSQTCGVINTGDDKIYLGASDINRIEKERKNRDRTDLADREFGIQLGSNGVDGRVISSLSTTFDVEPGDVLFQTQYLTISQFNRLLRKIDLDNGLDIQMSSITVGPITTIQTVADHKLTTGDYALIKNVGGTGAELVNGSHQVTVLDSTTFTIGVNTAIYTLTTGRIKFGFNASLSVSPGDNLTIKVSGLGDKLQLYVPNSDSDMNGNIGFKGAGANYCWDETQSVNTFLDLQVIFNLFSNRMNFLNEFIFTNYFESEGTLDYEVVITEKDSLTNKLTVFSTPIFLQGELTVYKGINSTVIWVPNPAGDPSIQKRILDATIIVDDQAFSNGEVEYSTDLSKGFSGTTFNAEGIGIFGQAPYGEEGFGGVASNRPIRTLTPRDKARCRYVSASVTHINAREEIKIFGISLTVENVSQRAYRGRDL